MENVWILRCFEGGDAGGVAGVLTCEAGEGPGEQKGRCLFGSGIELSLAVSKLKAGV